MSSRPRPFAALAEVLSCSGMLLSIAAVLASQLPSVVVPTKPAVPPRVDPRLVPRALDRLAVAPGMNRSSS